LHRRQSSALTQPYNRARYKTSALLIRLRVFAKFLGAGDSYLTLESVWNLIAVKILVAADDDPCDLQGIVLAPSGIVSILLEKAVVEMYFSRTAFDDYVTAVCHVNLSF
jgi:hypothetical protein